MTVGPRLSLAENDSFYLAHSADTGLQRAESKTRHLERCMQSGALYFCIHFSSTELFKLYSLEQPLTDSHQLYPPSPPPALPSPSSSSQPPTTDTDTDTHTHYGAQAAVQVENEASVCAKFWVGGWLDWLEKPPLRIAGSLASQVRFSSGRARQVMRKYKDTGWRCEPARQASLGERADKPTKLNAGWLVSSGSVRRRQWKPENEVLKGRELRQRRSVDAHHAVQSASRQR